MLTACPDHEAFEERARGRVVDLEVVTRRGVPSPGLRARGRRANNSVRRRIGSGVSWLFCLGGTSHPGRPRARATPGSRRVWTRPAREYRTPSAKDFEDPRAGDFVAGADQPAVDDGDAHGAGDHALELQRSTRRADARRPAPRPAAASDRGTPARRRIGTAAAPRSRGEAVGVVWRMASDSEPGGIEAERRQLDAHPIARITRGGEVERGPAEFPRQRFERGQVVEDVRVLPVDDDLDRVHVRRARWRGRGIAPARCRHRLRRRIRLVTGRLRMLTSSSRPWRSSMSCSTSIMRCEDTKPLAVLASCASMPCSCVCSSPARVIDSWRGSDVSAFCALRRTRSRSRARRRAHCA